MLINTCSPPGYLVFRILVEPHETPLTTALPMALLCEIQDTEITRFSPPDLAPPVVRIITGFSLGFFAVPP
jgi:hypothetical protein